MNADAPSAGFPPPHQQFPPTSLTQSYPPVGPPPSHPNYNNSQFSQPHYQNNSRYQQQTEKQDYTFEQRFAIEKPKYNDLWAGALFIVDVLGFAVVSAFALRGYATTRSVQGTGIYDDDQNDFGLSTNTIILFMFVLGLAFMISYVYLLAVRAFTKPMIYATGILNILLGLGTAIYFFSRKYYSPAIIFLVFSILYVFAFWSWMYTIPFAVLMLQTVIDVAKKFGHVFLVSFLGGVVALAFGAWFAITFVAVYARWSPNPNNPACSEGGCSRARVVGLLVFVTFSGYWITEFIKNTMHTTVSGVYGSWYFCSRSPAGMPKQPTIGAFKRAMTYSFGSVSFGSLIVSIIQLLRRVAIGAQSRALTERNTTAYAALCCVTCLLWVVEWVMQYFNHYAYSMIALYGKAFVPTAKDTWKMTRDRGFDALINASLINPILTMGAVGVGYLGTLLAYLYLTYTSPSYNKDEAFTPVVLGFAFLVGLQTANVILNPLKSGVATLFVAMAWDPAVLYRDFSDLYQKMLHVYPGVQYAVSHV